jgi:hypothetical protein
MSPFDCYKTYLSLKNHFTKKDYDYHKYCGKSRSSLQSFYKRKDRFWFEKLSRNKTDKEILEFFVSNFISSDDPSVLWIGEIIKEGDVHYNKWKKKIQSLSYLFKEETTDIFSTNSLDEVFDCTKGHPLILKKFLSGEISIETMVICDKVFFYSSNFDKKLKDPIWEVVGNKIKKYSPFLNIDIFYYKKILKECIL